MPVIYVIAGPNGIGKTTSAFDILPENIPFINSDEIAREASDLGLISVNTQEYSNREALKLVDGHITQRLSFAIETNLSDIDTWKFLIKTQELGYELQLKYISADSIDLLNTRIAERVKLGEHFVRPDIVEQRYVAGLKLLQHYFNYPDVLELFDNAKAMRLIAEFRKGKGVTLSGEAPNWVMKYFSDFLMPLQTNEKKRPDLSNIDSVRALYKELREKR